MNFKALLLGSAAAMLVAGASQAADLTTAEPVDYVKVCDAFGAGFFYSPGTDTCIKIGGYVKFGTNVNGTGGDNIDSQTHWGSFYTEASIQLTASSVTEYGNLTGWIDLRTRTGSSYAYNASGYDPSTPDKAGHIDSAYLELGGLKAGHFTSAFDFLGGYTDFGAFRADQSTDHIQYTYALGSFGLIGSIEDGSDRSGTIATYLGESASPDLVAALTYAAGPINAKLSAAYVNDGSFQITNIDPTRYDVKNGYAVQLGVEVALDQFGKGDKFGIQGVYTNNAPQYSGAQKFYSTLTPILDTSVYGGFVSYLHYWNPSLWSAIEASYLRSGHFDYPFSGTDVHADVWQISASTDWAIVKNLDLMLDGSYAKGKIDGSDLGSQSLDQWSVNVWLKRSW